MEDRIVLTSGLSGGLLGGLASGLSSRLGSGLVRASGSRAVLNVLVAVNTDLDGGGDRAGELLGDVLEGLGGLGDESLGEVLGSLELGVETLLHDTAESKLDDLLLAVDEILHHGGDILSESIDGADEGEAIGLRHLLSAIGGLHTLQDEGNELLVGGLDSLGVLLSLEGADHLSEVVDGLVDVADDASEDGSLALDGVGDGANDGQAEAEDGRELHCGGIIKYSNTTGNEWACVEHEANESIKKSTD